MHPSTLCNRYVMHTFVSFVFLKVVYNALHVALALWEFLIIYISLLKDI
jgi:hypothetical protein